MQRPQVYIQLMVAHAKASERFSEFSRLLIGAFLDALSAACNDSGARPASGLPGEVWINPIPEGVALTGANLCSTVQEPELLLGSSAFGALLRRHRLAAGLSQEALAERATLSTDGISALERGHRRTPQRQTIALLVGALALNVEQRRGLEAAARRSGLSRAG
jgi:DNA-binding XRE family transcriptional regulator